MINLKENIILYLVFLMIVISLITPASIYFFGKSNGPTASVSTGIVSLTVVDGSCGDTVCSGNETCSNCETDCGVCTVETSSGSGGGGGGSNRLVYDVNFDENNNYLDLRAGNNYVFRVTLNSEIYDFEVISFNLNDEVTLEYNSQQFSLKRDELGNFDLDGDGKTDFSVDFNGQFLDFKRVLIEKPIKETEAGVGFDKEKIVRPLGLDALELNYGILSIFLVIVFVVLLLMIYQSVKLKRLEKNGHKTYEKIYHNYNKTKKSSKDKTLALNKLERQRQLLEKARDMKLISDSSYNVSIKKINSLKKKF